MLGGAGACCCAGAEPLPDLPVTEFAMQDVGEALRFMSTGRHVGKLVIVASDVRASAPLPALDVARPHADEDPTLARQGGAG